MVHPVSQVSDAQSVFILTLIALMMTMPVFKILLPVFMMLLFVLMINATTRVHILELVRFRTYAPK